MSNGIFVDIGGTHMRFGVCGISVYKPEIIIKTPSSREDIVDSLCKNICALKKQYVITSHNVLISCAGLISIDGFIENALYLDLNGLNLRGVLESQCNSHVIVENDANIQAFGCFNGVDSLLYVAIGTAIGGAYVDNQGIFKGDKGFACEFGHIFVDSGRNCFCGRNGCLDSILSGKRMIENFGDGWWTRTNETDICEYLQFCGKKLVNALNSLNALFNPGEIVVCGKICDIETFCSSVYESWERSFWGRCKLSFEIDTWKFTHQAACKILQ